MSTSGTASIRVAAPAAVPGSASTCRTEPTSATSAAAASSLAWLRPVTITAAPSAASFFAMASPIPAVEPVTSAVLPANCKSMRCLPYRFES